MPKPSVRPELRRRISWNKDVQEKKERVSARKENKKRKYVSPQASKKKLVARKSRKATSSSSDDSYDDNAGKEIPMYDQRALLDKPYQTPSPAKVSPPLRSSLRLAPVPSDKPLSSTAPAATRKLLPDEKADAASKKANTIVLASTEELEYDFDLIFDIIKGASYDAVEDKKLLEQMRRDAKTEPERKDVNKGILENTKALTVMRNNKIEWTSKLTMDVSQLCDQRNDELKRQANLARRTEREEKRQKAKGRAHKPKTSLDRRIQPPRCELPFLLLFPSVAAHTVPSPHAPLAHPHAAPAASQRFAPASARGSPALPPRPTPCCLDGHARSHAPHAVVALRASPPSRPARLPAAAPAPSAAVGRALRPALLRLPRSPPPRFQPPAPAVTVLSASTVPACHRPRIPPPPPHTPVGHRGRPGHWPCSVALPSGERPPRRA
nr:protein diaphanous homolog 1-like [Aegilops tauschii subsp. strangulata]